MMVRILMLLAFLFISNTSHARVDIIPRLLLIENKEKSADVFVLNLSDKINLYKIKVIAYKQNSEGNYERVEGPLSESFKPSETVRISPQEFKLAPGNKQKVKVAIRRPTDLTDGEYRFHLVATGYDDIGDPASEKDQELSVQLKINLGIAIPVIIRQGDLGVEASLEDFELVEPNKTKSGHGELKFTAKRNGNASSLGKIEVFWARDNKFFEPIGFITNFNLFTEINQRKGSVPLKKFPVGGTIRVLYTDTETGQVYDEVVFEE